LEMEMHTGAVTRAAGDPEQRALRDLLAGLHTEGGEVRVERDHVRRHLDEDDLPVTLEAGRVTDVDHLPRRGGGDVERVEHADVETRVVPREGRRHGPRGGPRELEELCRSRQMALDADRTGRR